MAKYNFLITGLSGTGKTTICRDLVRRGYRALDADEVFGYHADRKTGKPNKGKNQEDWIWHKQKLLGELCDKSEEIVFICGGAMNQQEFYPYFTALFNLMIDNKTLNKRLDKRASEGHHMRPEDRAVQLKWNQNQAQGDLAKGMVAIDASKPVRQVADNIVKYIKQESFRPSARVKI